MEALQACVPGRGRRYSSFIKLSAGLDLCAIEAMVRYLDSRGCSVAKRIQFTCTNIIYACIDLHTCIEGSGGEVCFKAPSLPPPASPPTTMESSYLLHQHVDVDSSPRDKFKSSRFGSQTFCNQPSINGTRCPGKLFQSGIERMMGLTEICSSDDSPPLTDCRTDDQAPGGYVVGNAETLRPWRPPPLLLRIAGTPVDNITIVLTRLQS